LRLTTRFFAVKEKRFFSGADGVILLEVLHGDSGFETSTVFSGGASPLYPRDGSRPLLKWRLG
jgi:hypothetical protein